MSFSLREVVPWGRSFDEYVDMFSLGEIELKGKILGCSDGPASFNCQLTKLGGSVVSVDPIYQLTEEEIEHRIKETFDLIIEQTKANASEFVWERIRSIQDLGKIRLTAMKNFLADFTKGKIEKRYRYGKLPQLIFSNDSFDIALCSHFLFLYSEQLDLSFHLQSIRELCRVAKEVRIFPIMELGANKSRHIEDTIVSLTSEGYQVNIEEVDYEFQEGGNEMLRVKASNNCIHQTARSAAALAR